MAVVTSQIAVGAGAAVLVTAGAPDVVIRNALSQPVFLGGSTVTPATGFELPAGASITTDAAFGAGDDVYAICAAGTASRVDTLKVT